MPERCLHREYAPTRDLTSFLPHLHIVDILRSHRQCCRHFVANLLRALKASARCTIDTGRRPGRRPARASARHFKGAIWAI